MAQGKQDPSEYASGPTVCSTGVEGYKQGVGVAGINGGEPA